MLTDNIHKHQSGATHPKYEKKSTDILNDFDFDIPILPVGNDLYTFKIINMLLKEHLSL